MYGNAKYLENSKQILEKKKVGGLILRQYKLGIYKVFYLLYIVLLILFVSKTINCIIYYNNYSKEEYIKLHKVSLQNLNYIIEDTYKRF